MEGNGAHGGGNKHSATRVEVGADFDGAREGFDDKMDAFESDAVAEGMENGTGVGFDAVCEGVGAGGGGEFGRKADGDFGVKNDEVGEKRGLEEDGFAAGAFDGDDAAAADFGAGASGGRNANAGSEAAPIVGVFKVFEFEIRTLDEEANGLANIERAAAAESDHAVAVIVSVSTGAIDDVGLDGVRMDFGIEGPPLPFRAEWGEGFVEEVKRFSWEQAGVRDDKRFAHADSRQARWDFGECAGAVEGWRRK